MRIFGSARAEAHDRGRASASPLRTGAWRRGGGRAHTRNATVEARLRVRLVLLVAVALERAAAHGYSPTARRERKRGSRRSGNRQSKLWRAPAAVTSRVVGAVRWGTPGRRCACVRSANQRGAWLRRPRAAAREGEREAEAATLTSGARAARKTKKARG